MLPIIREKQKLSNFMALFKPLIVLSFTLVSSASFANSEEVILNCENGRGVSKETTGYLGDVEIKESSRVPSKNITVSISGDECVFDWGGATAVFEFKRATNTSYECAKEKPKSSDSVAKKNFKKWSISINRMNGILTYKHFSDYLSKDDYMVLSIFDAKWECKKASKLF